MALPAAEGVPLMTPLVALTVSPLGRPVALNVRGKWVAAILYVNAVPCLAAAVTALVMTGRTGARLICNAWLPVPPALVALTVAL